ncbi:hypothetical protein Tco_1368501 [Tanacetum coccineum]
MHDSFKNIQPWNNKFNLKSKLAWISIEGLPPQAWHEAAFTRLAGEWGEVIFPETCNTNSLNLVAGKVFIRTKCMEIIQHNMPVIIDDIHVCVRIRELIGECNEICPAKKVEYDDHTSSSDDDSVTNHDINTNGHESHEGNSDDDEDYFYDGGSGNELFLDTYRHGGGWIRDEDDQENYNVSSHGSGCDQRHDVNKPVGNMGEKNSNFLATTQSQSPEKVSTPKKMPCQILSKKKLLFRDKIFFLFLIMVKFSKSSQFGHAQLLNLTPLNGRHILHPPLVLVFTAEKRGQREDGLMDDIHFFSNRAVEHIPAISSRIQNPANVENIPSSS